MFGGELIATGSDSCVFIPNLPCKRTDRIDDNRVSKIIYSEGAEEDSLEEKKMNDKIKKIKGYSSWAIIFDQFCKPLPKHVLMDYDEEGLDDCIGDDSYLQDDFDKHSYMMNGIYGGETMDDYFYRSFESKKMSLQEINKAFLEFMKMMEPLFLGLKKMGEKKIIHNDIKSNNIVVHDGVFKYIDFGLAGIVSDKQHFKQRSQDELRSNRIYLYYPLEYLLFYATKSQLDEELWKVENKQKRDNFDYLNSIHSIFGVDAIDIYYGTIYGLRNKEINETKMIKGIDVYSLGTLVPLLLLRTNLSLKLEDSQMILDFYNLFGMMLAPLSNIRISAEDAYKQFKSLLNKYQKGWIQSPLKKKETIKRGRKRTGKKRTVVNQRRQRGKKRTIVKSKKKRTNKRTNKRKIDKRRKLR